MKRKYLHDVSQLLATLYSSKHFRHGRSGKQKCIEEEEKRRKKELYVTTGMEPVISQDISQEY